MAETAPIPTGAAFARRVLVALGLAALVVALVLVVWAAHRALLIVFCGVLVGVLLDGIGGAVGRLLRVDRWWALRGVLIVGVAGIAVTALLAGDALVAQFTDFVRDLPAAFSRARDQLAQLPGAGAVGEQLPDPAQMAGNVDVGRITGLFSSVAGGLASLFVIGFVGLYLALAPHQYVDNATRLFPPRARPRATEVLTACHRALRHWLLGRLVDMIGIATLTGVGLAALGVPYALPLAVVAGLLAFVPYLGPLLSLVPAVLVATAGGPAEVAAVVGLYAAILLVETYVVTPRIERRAVGVPPATGLAAQLVLGVLIGAIGVLVATPLLVVATVLVRTLWIEDGLREDVAAVGQT